MKKSISLILGSGGARGYAHIGVIEALMEYDCEIKSISGSSMGALIGALYACNKLQEYKEWVLTLNMLDVAKLVDFSIRKGGIIQGEKVFRRIEKMIGEVLIEDLDISFTAVATDIMRKKEVWIQKGKLLDAVRASVAIPTILTPQKIEGRYLIDGGVLNPVPIAPTMSDNTDLTIVVSLDAESAQHNKVSLLKKDVVLDEALEKNSLEIEQKTEQLKLSKAAKKFEEMSIFNILGHTLDTMSNVISDFKKAGYYPDITINIPHDACGFYEFNKAQEMIEQGRIIALECFTAKLN